MQWRDLGETRESLGRDWEETWERVGKFFPGSCEILKCQLVDVQVANLLFFEHSGVRVLALLIKLDKSK